MYTCLSDVVDLWSVSASVRTLELRFNDTFKNEYR